MDSRFGLTPLHFAVRNGRVEVAQLLIENGASLTPSTQGITPLDWTTEYLDPKQRNALLRFAHKEFSVLLDDTTRHET